MDVKNQKLTTYTAIGIIAFIIAIMVFVQIDRARGTLVDSVNIDYKNQPVLGDENAPVKIAIFEDFRCGGCALFTENTEPKIVRDYVDTGKASLYFFNMPILGAQSLEAAQAAECVYKEDPEKFWDYKTYAYRTHLAESSSSMNAARLSEIAKLAIGDIDEKAIEECALEAWHDKEVQKDLDIGHKVNISATPGIVVNGTLVTGNSYDVVKKIIDKELAQAN